MQIAVLPFGGTPESYAVDEGVIALCDDGTLWRLSPGGEGVFPSLLRGEWDNLPDIPQGE